MGGGGATPFSSPDVHLVLQRKVKRLKNQIENGGKDVHEYVTSGDQVNNTKSAAE